MRLVLCAALAAGTMMVAPASASVSFSASYVFGDSLSDNGNAADALGTHLPNPPYFHDSFTNGDVAVQVMSQHFGLSANPSLFPPSAADPSNVNFLTGNGTNYSFAGATAGQSRGQGQPGANIANQVGYYLAKSSLVADPDALYTVFIGGNDVRKAAQTFDSSYIAEGVATEVGAIQALLNAGAKHLLVINVPDIGKIPEYALENPGSSALATSLTLGYNGGLAAALAATVAGSSANIYQFDLFAFDTEMRANAASLGITNTIDPCYTSYPLRTPVPITTSAACGSTNGGTTQAENIESLYYWDNHHPTAKVHAALGNALADYVFAAEAPEPASWAMMLGGFGFVGAALRRRKIVVRFA